MPITLLMGSCIMLILLLRRWCCLTLLDKRSYLDVCSTNSREHALLDCWVILARSAFRTKPKLILNRYRTWQLKNVKENYQ
jgi:hypothetical protein